MFSPHCSVLLYKILICFLQFCISSTCMVLIKPAGIPHCAKNSQICVGKFWCQFECSGFPEITLWNCNFCSCIDPEGGSRIPRTGFGASQPGTPRTGVAPWPGYWPFVWGIHESPVNSPHKGQWRGALMFSLIWAWMNGWVNNREAGDLRRHRTHYDGTVMNCLTQRDYCDVMILTSGHPSQFQFPSFLQLCVVYRIIVF